MHLVATPRVYQRLKREIETKLKHSNLAGLAKMHDLADMTYLKVSTHFPVFMALFDVEEH